MKKVYIDADFKCHVINDGTMTAVQTEFFDGKCGEFIEGYRLVPEGMVWIREDGEIFRGEMIAPWKPYHILRDIQEQHEAAAASYVEEE